MLVRREFKFAKFEPDYQFTGSDRMSSNDASELKLRGASQPSVRA